MFINGAGTESGCIKKFEVRAYTNLDLDGDVVLRLDSDFNEQLNNPGLPNFTVFTYVIVQDPDADNHWRSTYRYLLFTQQAWLPPAIISVSTNRS